jgi:hypothetical protein
VWLLSEPTSTSWVAAVLSAGVRAASGKASAVIFIDSILNSPVLGLSYAHQHCTADFLLDTLAESHGVILKHVSSMITNNNVKLAEHSRAGQSCSSTAPLMSRGTAASIYVLFCSKGTPLGTGAVPVLVKKPSGSQLAAGLGYRRPPCHADRTQPIACRVVAEALELPRHTARTQVQLMPLAQLLHFMYLHMETIHCLL